MKAVLIIMAMLTSAPSWAVAGGRLHPEKVYQKAWCDAHMGTIPVHPIKEGLYPDCLIPDALNGLIMAIEFDHGYSTLKIAECGGQARQYAYFLGLAGGCVIIIETPSDQRRYDLLAPAWRGVVKMWKMTPKDLE